MNNNTGNTVYVKLFNLCPKWIMVLMIGYAFLKQELVPNNVLPDDFVRALKYSDYSSVSFISLDLKLLSHIHIGCYLDLTLFACGFTH